MKTIYFGYLTFAFSLKLISLPNFENSTSRERTENRVYLNIVETNSFTFEIRFH